MPPRLSMERISTSLSEITFSRYAMFFFYRLQIVIVLDTHHILEVQLSLVYMPPNGPSSFSRVSA